MLKQHLSTHFTLQTSKSRSPTVKTTQRLWRWERKQGLNVSLRLFFVLLPSHNYFCEYSCKQPTATPWSLPGETVWECAQLSTCLNNYHISALSMTTAFSPLRFRTALTPLPSNVVRLLLLECTPAIRQQHVWYQLKRGTFQDPSPTSHCIFPAGASLGWMLILHLHGHCSATDPELWSPNEGGRRWLQSDQ